MAELSTDQALYQLTLELTSMRVALALLITLVLDSDAPSAEVRSALRRYQQQELELDAADILRLRDAEARAWPK